MAKRQVKGPAKTPDKEQAKTTCKHIFIGTKDGVECSACGLKLTAEEYRLSLKDN